MTANHPTDLLLLFLPQLRIKSVDFLFTLFQALLKPVHRFPAVLCFHTIYRCLLLPDIHLTETSLKSSLSDLGAEVTEINSIKIKSTKENLKEYLDKLPEYDHIILTSVNGVNNFFDYLIETGYDVRNIKAKFSVVGKATKNALISKGIQPFIMAREFVGEGLVKALSPYLSSGEKVLLPCSSSSRTYLYDEISSLGLHVDRVHTYDTICGTLRNKRVFDEVDYVLFTSPSTVTNMIDMLGLEAISEKKLIAIGPQTAKAIRAKEMECVMCKKHSEDGFLKEIIEFKEAENV